MKLLLVITSMALSAFQMGCGPSTSSASLSKSSANSSSSSVSTSPQQEATLSGESGVAQVAGDKIELKSGTVFVNGVSYGAVPSGALVQYAVTGASRVLTVGGEMRSPVQ